MWLEARTIRDFVKTVGLTLRCGPKLFDLEIAFVAFSREKLRGFSDR